MGGQASELLHFGPGEGVPNNPRLPVVLMRGALAADSSPSQMRDVFEANGWTGTWTWTVYPFHHYHPDAHEVLGVVQGWADIRLGGRDGVTLRLVAGDVVVLPAGTGHKREAASPDFAVCGAYPPGQANYSTTRADADEARADAGRVERVPLPMTCPVFGADGPLTRVWRPLNGETSDGS